MDSNSNGVLDKGESGIPNISISIYRAENDSGPSFTAVTNAAGKFVVGGTFIEPLTSYYCAIDHDSNTEPIHSSYPTTTVRRGYQVLNVTSGRAGSSRLNFNIGYTPGTCGFVPSRPVRNARRILSMLKSTVSKGNYRSATLLAAATKIAEASVAVGSIKARTYRCGDSGGICGQTTVTSNKEVAITNIGELRRLLRKQNASTSTKQHVELLIKEFLSVAPTIPDIVEDCS